MTDEQRQRLSDLLKLNVDNVVVVDSDEKRELSVKDIIMSTRDYGRDKRAERKLIIVLDLTRQKEE
ncbi:hypothetical protein LCGC14_1114040 [marine sediment metagenome]|uniref:Uncharacterized protein n=1 Tax=marine sediment metagenome TaxID=412755 RepID=A0A0F9MAR0_9ZZZZ